jgi:hypothetical protein
MRLYELVVDNWDEDGVFALSLVSDPAIEVMGTYFNKEKILFKELDEQGLFVAPILIPEKKILRMDGKGEMYEVYLAKDTVKSLAHMYLKNKFQDSVTIEHEDKVEDVTLVESWITDSTLKDKSKDYGINVPAGSWMGVFAIDNEEIRQKFRDGEIGAISIEGVFQHLEKVERNNFSAIMDKDVNDLTEEEAEIVLNKIKAVVSKDKRYKVNQSEPSVTSTYPGESSGSYTSPELLVEEGELDVYGYETEKFYMCPGAVGTFKSILEEEVGDDVRDMVRAAAVFADGVFDIEEDVIEDGKATPEDLRKAQTLVDMFKDVFKTVSERLSREFDISYMDGHIEVIKRYL